MPPRAPLREPQRPLRATDARPKELALLACRASIMQAHGLDANGSGSSSALQAQQMAGERLVNQCRIGLTVFGALTILTASDAQTRAANGVFVAVVCVLAIYSGLVWQWLKSGLSHAIHAQVRVGVDRHQLLVRAPRRELGQSFRRVRGLSRARHVADDRRLQRPRRRPLQRQSQPIFRCS